MFTWKMAFKTERNTLIDTQTYSALNISTGMIMAVELTASKISTVEVRGRRGGV